MNPTTPSWAEALHLRLSEAIPRGSDVALFDFPFYLNPGDSAIAAGELSWLARNDSRVVAVTRRETVQSGYWPVVSGGVILLLNGGGNIGDLYPEHRVLLEQVLKTYPENDVVLFPQSINFRDPREAAGLADQVRLHAGRVTLMWRDTRSLEIAGRLVPSACHVLAPDAAAGFLGWQRLCAPTESVTHLLREDQESSGLALRGVSDGDWPYSSSDRAAWHAMRWRHRFLDRHPERGDEKRRELYFHLSAMNLRNALNRLSAADVVVTDRLHGHILCTLMGIPNVVLADSYGKLSNYYSSWSRGIPFVGFAESLNQVPKLVDDLRGRCR